MRKNLPLLVRVAALLPPTWAPAGPPCLALPSSCEQSEHVRRDVGHFDKAAAHYEWLTALDPVNINAYVTAALVSTEDGRLAEAPYHLTSSKRKSNPQIGRQEPMHCTYFYTGGGAS